MKKLLVAIFSIVIIIVVSVIILNNKSFKFELASKDKFYQKYSWGEFEYATVTQNNQIIEDIKITNPREYSGVAFELLKRIDIKDARDNDGYLVFKIKLLEPENRFYVGFSDLVLNKDNSSSSKTVVKLDLERYINKDKKNWQTIKIPLSKFSSSGEYWLPVKTVKQNINWSKIFAYRFQIDRATVHFQIKDISIRADNEIYEDNYPDLLPDISSYKKLIKINQLGYIVAEKKMAYVSFPVTEFVLANVTNGEKTKFGRSNVYRVKDDASAEYVYALDFTSLQKPGSYRIELKGNQSVEFEVRDDYDNIEKALQTVLDAFRFQRCGESVSVNNLSRVACHGVDSYFDNDSMLDATGGWHDAGDFSKQIVYASIAVAQMLDAYSLLKDKRPAIASKILSEVEYELDWFLKMQTEDGGVYHRLMTELFASSYYGNWVSPEDDLQERYVYEKTTLSTATFAAVMAFSSRIYKEIDETKSANYLASAIRANRYLNNNPRPILDSFTDDVDDIHKRLWAAMELYIATKEPRYMSFVNKMLKDKKTMATPSWENPLSIGLLHYFDEQNNDLITEEIQKMLFSGVDNIMRVYYSNGYPSTLFSWEYYWGSNAVILNKNLLLMAAYRYTGNQNIKDVIYGQVGYIFGLNSLGKSFVTGIGYNSVQRPWHPYHGEEYPLLPGLLVGGANQYPKGADRLLKMLIDSKVPPAKSYVDNASLDFGSWASNETQVNLNSALVLSLAFLLAESN